MKDINNMSDIEIMAINKMHLEDRIIILEEKLAEKDKEIKNLENKWEELVSNNYELQQTQLYKEDFHLSKKCYGCLSNNFNNKDKCNICGGYKVIKFKDNSKYDKLPSKEENNE